MTSRYRRALAAGLLLLAVALSACSTHDTGTIGGGNTSTAPGPTSPPISAAFVNNPLGCSLIPVTDVSNIVHPPAPLHSESTLQDAGSYAIHAKCKEATADNQHGVTFDLYRVGSKALAQSFFKNLSAGADLVVTGLGDQAMRSFGDLFVLKGLDVFKVTYLEPFDPNMQSDAHQNAVGKILIPLGQLALQHVGALAPFTPTTSTSTTVRHTTTTRRR
jgi:hypothetical protein